MATHDRQIRVRDYGHLSFSLAVFEHLLAIGHKNRVPGKNRQTKERVFFVTRKHNDENIQTNIPTK